MNTILTILIPVLEVLVRLLAPALLSELSPTSSDALRQQGLRRKLKDRVQRTWPAVILLCLLIAGCTRHTVYVPAGEPVRLREMVKDVKVWVMTESGPVPGKMDLPEGWYCLPVSE